ncbi:MAG: sigma 54-interacting transcriptional regulator [Colwellia sp.]
MSEKFTLVTPFFQRHGIGFLDVILKTINDSGGHVTNDFISEDQYIAFKKILKNGELKNLNKVIYLLPKDYKAVDAVSLWKEFKSEEKLKLVRESIKKTSKNFETSKNDLTKLINDLDNNDEKRFPDYQWLKNHWTHHKDLWHIINEFSLATQVEWYKKNSTIFEKYGSKKIEFIELDLTYLQLEDEEKVAKALKKWIENTTINANTYINLWGISTSFQIAFYYLSWSSPRLKQSTFIKCKTPKKAKDEQRFTPIEIVTANKDLLATLESNKTQNYKLSDEQQDTLAWLKKYKEFDDNFTIMLLGPRGTGKTTVVQEVYDPDNKKDKVISVNCAQFQSNPALAISELFGHKKGAFTGATENRDGAFRSAKNKVLFLDEVHHLDKATQAMLLTALQTESDGNFTFTPLGENKPSTSKFQLIVASNKEQDELAEFILPDLLDRITQRVLKFNAIEAGSSIKNKFNTVWDDMLFKGSIKPENPLLEKNSDNFDLNFHNWLTHKSRRFEGNYRDLQTIAILSADYQRCKSDDKLIKKSLTLVDYIEQNWKPPSKKKEISIENFLNESGQISLVAITNEFKAKIVRSAEYFSGDQTSAAKMLGITPKSLIEIKKRDM